MYSFEKKTKKTPLNIMLDWKSSATGYIGTVFYLKLRNKFKRIEIKPTFPDQLKMKQLGIAKILYTTV